MESSTLSDQREMLPSKVYHPLNISHRYIHGRSAFSISPWGQRRQSSWCTPVVIPLL